MRKTRPIKKLQDVFEVAGGSTKLAATLNLHAYTVENWRRAGIPMRHWDTLFDLYGITPAELFYVTKVCRDRILKK